MTARGCTYPGNQPGQAFCGAAAVFSVLRRGYDPVHPDPDRDNLDRCREHLAATVEGVDCAAEPGYVVHVTVIASVRERQANAAAEDTP